MTVELTHYHTSVVIRVVNEESMGKRHIDEAAEWDVFISITAHWMCYDILEHIFSCSFMPFTMHENEWQSHKETALMPRTAIRNGWGLFVFSYLNIRNCWGTVAGSHQCARWMLESIGLKMSQKCCNIFFFFKQYFKLDNYNKKKLR